MKAKLLFACCMLSAQVFTASVFAEVGENEIVLFEVVSAGGIGGDEPLDGPDIAGTTPTRPTDFRATISGNVLSVNVDNSEVVAIRVRNTAGSLVVQSQFVGFTAEQLTTAGSYTLELQCEDLTLVGEFEVE